MKDWLSKGEFSKQTGLSDKALRLYEEKGILIPHTRSESQYRYYSEPQIKQAQRILHYKDLGFTLEQIKTLLQQTSESTLKELLEHRLQEGLKTLSAATTQVRQIQSILASINDGKELTEQQRSQIMDGILESSLQNLKRRGVIPDEKLVNQLNSEIAHLSPGLQRIIPDLQKVIQYAQDNNILLGPGRGNAVSSLVFHGLGYTPENPMKFGLIPELGSKAKLVMLDVEYSRHKEIGQMCDDIEQKHGFEVVAFRCPDLDIFQEMQKLVGPIEFNRFSDTDPMILDAAKRLGLRGLAGPEWNPNFHAFRSMPKDFQEEFDWDIKELERFYSENTFASVEDFMNIERLKDLRDEKRLFDYYKNEASAKLPELKTAHGYLLWREDWIRILMRTTGATVLQASDTLNALLDSKTGGDTLWFDKVEDSEIRETLLASLKTLFSKSYAPGWWWYFKRTAILKSLWKEQYLKVIDQWEQKNGIIWQEFGYKIGPDQYYLRANR